MNLNDLKSQIARGEDSRRQFKRDVTNADSLAAEMATDVFLCAWLPTRLTGRTPLA